MKKDINFHIAEKVQIVAVKEWDKEFSAQQWNVYLVNNRNEPIEMVLVLSRGTTAHMKTATLRHGLGDIAAHSAAKVEMIIDEVLSFTNEYLVTFFSENKLYEKSFVFPANRINESNTIEVEVLQLNGVLAE